jgi:hypothetical protein
MTEYWDIETQHTVGYWMMGIGTVLSVLVGIWAMSEWYGHPTWRDVAAFGPLILMVGGVSLLIYAIRLT